MTNRELEELGKKYYKDRSYKEAAETLSKVKDKKMYPLKVLRLLKICNFKTMQKNELFNPSFGPMNIILARCRKAFDVIF